MEKTNKLNYKEMDKVGRKIIIVCKESNLTLEEYYIMLDTLCNSFKETMKEFTKERLTNN